MSNPLHISLATEIALLGFPRREPLHGYEIYRRLNEMPELRAVWRMKQGRLYALLARLEEEGLLQATHEPQDNRPPRKVFHLTPTGETVFNQWLTEPVGLPREMRLDFMLKLYFAMWEDPSIITELLRRQQVVCADWLASQQKKDVAGSTYLAFVRRYRYGHIESIQNWLTMLANEFAGHQNPQ